jgi:ribonuclease R
MVDRQGEVYDGVVTGVTNFGLFVQLKELMVDGLVHVTNLPNDYYHYDAGRQQMVGERTGRTFALGETLRVLVQRVDMETRRIDFRLADLSHEAPHEEPRRSKRGRSKVRRR